MMGWPWLCQVRVEKAYNVRYFGQTEAEPLRGYKKKNEQVEKA